MTQQMKDAALGIEKFGIGQPVRRSEDPVLIRGEGRYSDDVNLAGQLYGVMVRSPIAHGILRGIDTQAAKATEGVLAVYTAKDLEPMGYGLIRCALPITNRDGSAMLGNGRYEIKVDIPESDITKIKVGDKVMFKKYAADELEISGEKVILISEGDILAVL